MIVIDMDMPKSCHECCCYDVEYQKCVIASKGIPNRYHYDGSAKPQWCPTVCDINAIRDEIEELKDGFIDNTKVINAVLDIIDRHLEKGEQGCN